jgi:hypothetical protein
MQIKCYGMYSKNDDIEMEYIVTPDKDETIEELEAWIKCEIDCCGDFASGYKIIKNTLVVYSQTGSNEVSLKEMKQNKEYLIEGYEEYFKPSEDCKLLI